jgi:receptor protein-tyrosine kinase
MTESSDAMSTIEKAAARLGKRGHARGDASARGGAEGTAPGDRPLQGIAGMGGPVTESGKPGAGAGAPRGYCEIEVESLRAKGYVTPLTGRSQLGQEMRRIKRPLLLNVQKAEALNESAANPANLIMVTSALPGEGKTFVSINLAMSLAAELDRRVLLVDADVARGDVSRTLGLVPARGLSDLLREQSRLAEDGVLVTNVDRLSILPAGAPVEHIDELYASSSMHDIVLGLAQADAARIVLFDSPPLLATTEAAVLARHMGQIVVVVEANRTPQKAVGDALALLDGCENVSLVLNKTTSSESAGYGYGYGYGQRDEGQD